VFLENVSRRAIETAGEDLIEMGYKAEAIALGAKDMGADHIRKRYWLLAYANDKSELCRVIDAKMEELQKLRRGLWETKPDESGVVDGVANRMDRFRAIGNGQVPIVAASALYILSQT